MTGDEQHDDQQLADTAADREVAASVERFRGPIITVRTDVVRLSADADLVERDYVQHPGAVAVVVLDAGGRVLLIDQYRHAVRGVLWELPAGILDVEGEDPLRAAQRELGEEADQQAGRWNVLVDLLTTPGASDEGVRVFLARDPSALEGSDYVREHEEADMGVRWVPLPEVVDAVLGGRVSNSLLTSGVLAVAAAQAREDGLDGLRPGDAPWPYRARRTDRFPAAAQGPGSADGPGDAGADSGDPVTGPA